jgi:cell division protein FtsB
MRKYKATQDLPYGSPERIERRAFGSLLCVLVMFYLGFHTVSGERGVFALMRETQRLATLKDELAEVKAKRQQLEAKTERLSDRSLDLDLLDERVRIVLGMAGKGEAVIFLDGDAAK